MSHRNCNSGHTPQEYTDPMFSTHSQSESPTAGEEMQGHAILAPLSEAMEREK